MNESPMMWFALSDEARPAFEVARHWLLAATNSRHAVTWSPLPDPLTPLAEHVVAESGMHAPRAAICHRTGGLPVHRDAQNPYPCMNALVVFRDRCEGGALWFPDDESEFRCDDGWVYVFDGQRPHSVSNTKRTGKGGYRLGLTFYMPLEDW